MKLDTLYNLNKHQIMVESCVKGKDVRRTLILKDLDSGDMLAQIQDVVKEIKTRYIDGGVHFHLVDKNPLVFTIVPHDGWQFFIFTIAFPLNGSHYQNGLITAISKLEGIDSRY